MVVPTPGGDNVYYVHIVSLRYLNSSRYLNEENFNENEENALSHDSINGDSHTSNRSTTRRSKSDQQATEIKGPRRVEWLEVCVRELHGVHRAYVAATVE